VSDLDQLRRNVQVMDLLTESYQAHERGDREAFERAYGEALECDPAVVSVLQGGMLIGEMPSPERDPEWWADFVAEARDKARAGRG
jgi:hypothetical protein